MSREDLLNHVVSYLLVAFRLAGLFLVAPLLSGVVTPVRFKALLVLMLAAAVYPIAGGSVRVPNIDMMTLAALVVTEAAIGFCVGFVASLPLQAMDMAGVIAGQQMGFGLAKIYNPEMDSDLDLMGTLFFYLGMAVLLAIGGLETVVSVVLRSFDTVPVGANVITAPTAGMVLGVAASGLELAVRVAAPAVGSIFLLIILFGVLTKSMPQLNVMTIGFTLKIMAAMLMTMAALPAISNAAGEAIHEALSAVTGWIDHAGVRGEGA